MLFSHIQNNDSIFMVVDEDADGYTSSAILLNYLHTLVPKYVESKIKYWVHEKKQHGIILDAIPEDTKLVIALDASSNEFELHKILAEKGIDVLIIDHHHAEKFSEYACVINNQMCDYPTKSLSGAGMTFKFCTYLDSLRDTNFANNFIDLAALGIISDMMDLRDLETRHIVSTGLSQVRNPFFKTMIKRNQRSIGDDLTPMGVAFYVTPFINAVTRIGNQDDKILMFESMLDFKAYEIIPSTKRGCSGQTETRVEQACRNCSNIKSRQATLRDKSLLTIENIIEEEHLLENKILAVRLADTSLDKNLTGLVANQIMGKYQKPVLILNKIVKEDGEIYWEGSGRGYGLEDTRQFL